MRNNSDAENRKKKVFYKDTWRWAIFNIWKDLDASICDKIGKVSPGFMP